MTREEIIKSALKFLVQKQIEQGSHGFSDADDNEISWDEVIGWLEQQPITWIVGKDNCQVAVRNMPIDKMQKICAIIGEEEQQPKTIQEKQAESEKYQKAFDDGYENGYAQARFDYEQQPCEGMRDATEEERKSTKDYIDSISKPTGFFFDEAYEEIVFVETHKKLSANLQPCEDCISREQAVYVASGYCEPQNIADELRKLPSVQPQPKRGKWIDQADSIGEYASGCYECDECHEVFWLESGTPQDNEYNFCPNCGADMREVQDER